MEEAGSLKENRNGPKRTFVTRSHTWPPNFLTDLQLC